MPLGGGWNGWLLGRGDRRERQGGRARRKLMRKR